MKEIGINIKLNFNEFINSRHAGVFVFIWSFVLGILVSSFVFIIPIYSLVLIGVGFIGIISHFAKASRDKLFLIFFLIILGFGLGAFRYAVKDFYEPDLNLISNIDEKITLKGLVVSEPEHRENDIRVVVKEDSSSLALGETSKILVATNLFSQVNYGDEVEVTGKLELPQVIDSENGREFDYKKYLSKDDIYYTMNFAQIKIIESNKGNKLKNFLYKIKSAFISQINKILVEPESSLLAGLLVAGKNALPKAVLDEFRRAGVVHIVVLSGYNIAIVAEFLKNVFSFLFLRLAPLASFLGILFFIFITGASSTVVRAGIMVSILLFSKSFGRNFSAPRALLVTFFLMLLENPKILIFDPSFQLSFLAVLALIYVEPIILKNLNKIPEKYGLRSVLSTTFATQIVVFPFLLYSMGNFSIVSIFSNMLILALVPLTMLLGFVSTLLSFIGVYLAWPFSFITHLLLMWILFVADYLGNLTFAQISIKNFPLTLMLVFYFLMLIFVYRKRSLSS